MIYLVGLFLIGYVFITIEHKTKIEKSGVSLFVGGLSWILLSAIEVPGLHFEESLLSHLAEISTIVFFLLAAMTIVEAIEGNHGFDLVTKGLNFTKNRSLLWAVALLTFGLSAILDNLATTIVMIAVVARLIKDKSLAAVFCGVIVIAANSGGAFSPIGDVTTTMLWIGGQISFPKVAIVLFLPSLTAMIIPLLMVARTVGGEISQKSQTGNIATPGIKHGKRNTVFVLGITVLVLVPILKALFHIPPFLSLLTGLGILWIVTEIYERRSSYLDSSSTNLTSYLRKIDLPSILFFLGILLAVSALEVVGFLDKVSEFMQVTVSSPALIALIVGLLSAVFDNVPLVSAVAKMFSGSVFPVDSAFWYYVAFCAGVGGSVLIVGSAAGVAAMGAAKISFGWYLRKISLPALLGFVAGWLVLVFEFEVLGTS